MALVNASSLNPKKFQKLHPFSEKNYIFLISNNILHLYGQAPLFWPPILSKFLKLFLKKFTYAYSLAGISSSYCFSYLELMFMVLVKSPFTYCYKKVHFGGCFKKIVIKKQNINIPFATPLHLSGISEGKKKRSSINFFKN